MHVEQCDLAVKQVRIVSKKTHGVMAQIDVPGYHAEQMVEILSRLTEPVSNIAAMEVLEHLHNCIKNGWKK